MLTHKCYFSLGPRGNMRERKYNHEHIRNGTNQVNVLQQRADQINIGYIKRKL